MRKRFSLIILLILSVSLCAVIGFFACRACFPHPYRSTVRESGLDEKLVYAVIKAESNFKRDATSSAGALGLMQIMPATAEFICERNKISFDIARLTEAEYNIQLGCLYLRYLLERFPCTRTALAAYNAGEGTVSGWLKNAEISPDGIELNAIPYPETAQYVKKVEKFLKIYRFLYH